MCFDSKRIFLLNAVVWDKKLTVQAVSPTRALARTRPAQRSREKNPQQADDWQCWFSWHGVCQPRRLFNSLPACSAHTVAHQDGCFPPCLLHFDIAQSSSRILSCGRSKILYSAETTAEKLPFNLPLGTNNRSSSCLWFLWCQVAHLTNLALSVVVLCRQVLKLLWLILFLVGSVGRDVALVASDKQR